MWNFIFSAQASGKRRMRAPKGREMAPRPIERPQTAKHIYKQHSALNSHSHSVWALVARHHEIHQMWNRRSDKQEEHQKRRY